MRSQPPHNHLEPCLDLLIGIAESRKRALYSLRQPTNISVHGALRNSEDDLSVLQCVQKESTSPLRQRARNCPASELRSEKVEYNNKPKLLNDFVGIEDLISWSADSEEASELDWDLKRDDGSQEIIPILECEQKQRKLENIRPRCGYKQPTQSLLLNGIVSLFQETISWFAMNCK